ncbi:MAG: 3-deoxy-D-manno-octulosonic acid transferase [Syntrophales bacterium]
MFLIYNVLLALSTAFLAPYYLVKVFFGGKYRKSIGPKLGIVPSGIFQDMKGEPRIWVHAVSVGEVNAAVPIIASLRESLPGACIVLSTATETGQEAARKMALSATACIYYPLDIPVVIRKLLKRVDPDIFVIVETELWPNFIRICKEKGKKIVMVNGRMSPRSFRRYFATRFFWQRVLACIDGLGAISETDAKRFKAAGASSDKIRVLGNSKYDALSMRVGPELKDETAGRLNIRRDAKVLVGGSTHEGEEKILFSVYRRVLASYPDLLLIIIPRHVERGRDILSCAAGEGFEDCIAMSDILNGRKREGERVVIVDVMGELFKIYSIASVVFCGGSLVPRGGQNILEPAAWGKVVLYGPFMDDFMDEKALLEQAGAGISVRNGEELQRKIIDLLGDPDALSRKGEAGKKIIRENSGAALRYAEMILQTIMGKIPGSKFPNAE